MYQQGVRKVSQGREESQSRRAEQIIAEWIRYVIPLETSGDSEKHASQSLPAQGLRKWGYFSIKPHSSQGLLPLIPHHILFDSWYFA